MFLSVWFCHVIIITDFPYFRYFCCFTFQVLHLLLSIFISYQSYPHRSNETVYAKQNGGSYTFVKEYILSLPNDQVNTHRYNQPMIVHATKQRIYLKKIDIEFFHYDLNGARVTVSSMYVMQVFNIIYYVWYVPFLISLHILVSCCLLELDVYMVKPTLFKVVNVEKNT